MAAFLLIFLSLLAFAFTFIVYLSFAKLLLLLATEFSVCLIAFYVLIIYLHFVAFSHLAVLPLVRALLT